MVFLLLIVLFSAFSASAQDDISFRRLNDQRIQTNQTGMKVLAGWGAANIVSGIAGYGIAKDNEWRSFHQMNAIWGVVNLGIAASGYFGAKKESVQQYPFSDALHRHEANKRLFLLNAGLDGLYITSGLLLTEHAKQATNHPEVWRGYGKSIFIQGVGLLIFDAVMFSAHSSKGKYWYKILSGVRIEGNGVGLNYTF